MGTRVEEASQSLEVILKGCSTGRCTPRGQQYDWRWEAESVEAPPLEGEQKGKCPQKQLSWSYLRYRKSALCSFWNNVAVSKLTWSAFEQTEASGCRVQRSWIETCIRISRDTASEFYAIKNASEGLFYVYFNMKIANLIRNIIICVLVLQYT